MGREEEGMRNGKERKGAGGKKFKKGDVNGENKVKKGWKGKGIGED